VEMEVGEIYHGNFNGLFRSIFIILLYKESILLLYYNLLEQQLVQERQVSLLAFYIFYSSIKITVFQDMTPCILVDRYQSMLFPYTEYLKLLYQTTRRETHMTIILIFTASNASNLVHSFIKRNITK
jgi:hypothetical protein